MGTLYSRYGSIFDAMGEWKEIGPDRAIFRCPQRTRHKHEDRNWSGRAKLGDRGQLVIRCFACGAGWIDFYKQLGVGWSACFPDYEGSQYHRVGRMDRKPIAHHRYEDERGQLIAVKMRYARGLYPRCEWVRPVPPGTLGLPAILPGGKHCVHALRKATYAGTLKGKDWHYYPLSDSCTVRAGQPVIELPEAKPSLFRLPSILETDPAQTIFLTEGESDVETLCRLGLVATCGAHGCNWLPEWSVYLRGRNVVVIPDNDDPGRQYAIVALGSLIQGGVGSVRVMTPGLHGYHPPEDGGDVTDWLAAQGLRGAIEQKKALMAVLAHLRAHRLEAA